MRPLLGLLALALTCILPGCGSSPGYPGASRGSSDVITQEEIRGSSHANVYELVESLHPNWLRTRGVNSFRESATGQGSGRELNVRPGQDTRIVYLNNARLGGLETLRQVSTADVTSVRFLSPAAATHRWGGGHSHGAILISTGGDSTQ